MCKLDKLRLLNPSSTRAQSLILEKARSEKTFGSFRLYFTLPRLVWAHPTSPTPTTTTTTTTTPKQNRNHSEVSIPRGFLLHTTQERGKTKKCSSWSGAGQNENGRKAVSPKLRFTDKFWNIWTLKRIYELRFIIFWSNVCHGTIGWMQVDPFGATSSSGL